ncbi:MAG TPA: sigma-70 family RNA polymerase sigma factor [Cyclobacteriaceae bacterium]
MGLHIYRAREDDLIHGCRRRDTNAQRELYDLFSPKMYALCYRYVRNPAEAEDVLVCAFMKVFEKIDQYRGEGSFEGWIRRIVVNEALTVLRRNRNMYLETDLDEVRWGADAAQLLDHLEVQDLQEMISELPPGYRIVFNMYAIDGYSHKEIADHLGISENTSKSQLSRARSHLRKLLNDYDVLSAKNKEK